MASPLTGEEVSVLAGAFPELSWMRPEDWQSVATYADWSSWMDDWEWRRTEWCEGLLLSCMVGLREQRVAIRTDCRSYFGEENVPNINDPEDLTWA